MLLFVALLATITFAAPSSYTVVTADWEGTASGTSSYDTKKFKVTKDPAVEYFEYVVDVNLVPGGWAGNTWTDIGMDIDDWLNNPSTNVDITVRKGNNDYGNGDMATAVWSAVSTDRISICAQDFGNAVYYIRFKWQVNTAVAGVVDDFEWYIDLWGNGAWCSLLEDLAKAFAIWIVIVCVCLGCCCIGVIACVCFGVGGTMLVCCGGDKDNASV